MQQKKKKKQMSVENIFIKYMDLASEAGVEREAKFQDDFSDVAPSFSQIANNLE